MKGTNFEQVSQLLAKQFKINSIYDIGANKGGWTRKYSKFFPKANFYMFEANPSMQKPDLTYDWFNLVLSDKDNKEVIFHEINSTGDSYYEEQTAFYSGRQKRHKLQTRSLDSVINEYNLPLPDIIKIDTQGSEVDIFKGGHNAIGNSKLLLTETPIIEYNKGAPKLHEYIDILRNYSLVPIRVEEIHIIDNTLIQIDIIFMKKDIKDNIFGGGTFINQNLTNPIRY